MLAARRQFNRTWTLATAILPLFFAVMLNSSSIYNGYAGVGDKSPRLDGRRECDYTKSRPSERERQGVSSSVSNLTPEARSSISRALGRDLPRYWARTQGGGFTTGNGGHSLAAHFTSAGVQVRSGGMHWRLALTAYGYGNALRPVKRALPQGHLNRVEYRRGALAEWYENGPVGLEQGFTINESPSQRGPLHAVQPLTIALTLPGNVRAVVDHSRKALTLVDCKGRADLRYTGLAAQDATGRKLRAWLEVHSEQLLLRVDDAGALYPLTVDPWIQLGKLTASDGTPNGGFGSAVAISGNIVVVGERYATIGSNSQQGAAYVFVESPGGWSNMVQTAKLTASDGAAGNELGFSVSISGNTVVAGAPFSNSGQGAAYVFVEPSGGWRNMTQTAKLVASDGSNDLGYSVSISGNTAVAGAPYAGGAGGGVYVFVEPRTGWANIFQSAKLSNNASVYNVGSSVSISGNTVVAGAPSGFGSSGADVWVEPATGWANMAQTAELTDSGNGNFEGLGGAVAISGNTAVVSFPGATVGVNGGAGEAYVFVEPTSGWANSTNPTAVLTASDGTANANLASSLSISGDTIVAGAPNAIDVIGETAEQGAAYVFVEPPSGWANMTQTAKLTASDGAAGDQLGYYVSISGDAVVAGAPNAMIGSNSKEGAAYVFGLQPPLSLGLHFDFDGSGGTDYTVWRPSNGTWYVLPTSGGPSLKQAWGENGDKVVPGDYDGDGITDYAVWRPSNGTWYVILSSTGKTTRYAWGESGDVPVPGDYDGDGRTDYAIWRASTGAWWVVYSSTGQQKEAGVWGVKGDIPVPGDYDGDGKTDLAVWRPSNGTFYVILSSTGKSTSYVWGLGTDIPVPGDYDGDGKTDYAVWRPSNGTWYVVYSSTGKSTKYVWGEKDDIPVERDYDGDGKTDYAVWRPSNGTWYVVDSSTGKTASAIWGLSTDVPVNKPTGE